VIHREPTRYDDDGEDAGDDDDAAQLQAPFPEGDDPWAAGMIKQFILQYKAEQFRTVVARMDALREVLEIDNNTDLVTRVLEEYQVEHDLERSDA
jgi:urease gamma subunit